LNANRPSHPRTSDTLNAVIAAFLDAATTLPEEQLREIIDARRNKEPPPLLDAPAWVRDRDGNWHPHDYVPKALRQKKARSIGYFVRTSRETCLNMSAKPLPRSAQVVLHYLLATCDFGNAIDTRQQDIADALGMARPNVARAIRCLIEAGYLVIPPQEPNAKPWKPGRPKCYILNPYRFAYGWDKENKAIQDQLPAP
jgi:hypothetical protein